MGQRLRSGLAMLPVGLLLGGLLWLGSLEAGGPPHADLLLEGGIPATLTLPGEPTPGSFGLPAPPPPEARPPVIVLIHGFSADRLGMSVLARSFAKAGYAVLSLDLRGHGENRNAFARDVTGAWLREDVRAAVEFARVSPHVDGSRVVVMGHSMGASAALDYAGHDSGLDGAVMISGGSRLRGPYRPPNALFIYATGDPVRIAESSREIVATLAGSQPAERGQLYGAFRDGTATRFTEVPGADHLTILYTSTAVREIVAWLDGIYRFDRGAEAAVSDPRLVVAGLCLLAFVLCLPGLGGLIGRLAPAQSPPPAAGAGHSIVFIGLGLLVTLPLFAVTTPGRGIPLEVADVVVAHLFAAGVMLWVAFTNRGGNALFMLERPLASALAAAIGLLAVYVMLVPLGVVGHRVTLTPERTLAFFVLAALLLPFTSVFHFGLRRGPVGRATAFSIAGRVLVVGVLALGAITGVSSGVVMLMLPTLAVLFVLVEVLSVFVYARSGNIAVPALIEAGWLAWVFAAVLPIRI